MMVIDTAKDLERMTSESVSLSEAEELVGRFMYLSPSDDINTLLRLAHVGITSFDSRLSAVPVIIA